jgi:hypothetical protein
LIPGTPNPTNEYTIRNTGVTSFNGLTGTVTLTGDGSALFGYGNNRIGARLGSYTLTGVASYDPQFFGIGLSGHLVLTGAYQVTGDTVAAGSNVTISRSGNTVTVNANEGLGSYTLTGVASYDPRFFGIGLSGHLVLTGAYQVTGDTVQAGSFINIGAGKTINNIGVQTFNGLTGARTLTGDGWAIRGIGNNAITAITGGCGFTGVVGVDCTKFVINGNGIITGLVATNACDPPPTTQAECVACGGQWQANFPSGGSCILSLAPSYSGLGVSAGADGTISYFYFDAGNLTFNSALTIDKSNDYVLFYDASETGVMKTKRVRPERVLLDNDAVFNSKSSQFVKSKSSTNIEFEILTAAVSAGETKLLKSGDAYTYITQNTVKSLNGQTGDVAVVGSLNGCTGTITITGTVNEVMVSNSCPTITIGLPDNVSIPYLSGTGATFTQTVTATRFIGIVSGGDF